MAAADREKSLEAALAQIDRQFGKGSVMRLGDEVRAPMEVIPTGSIALDIALGIGGLPRGRVVEVYGPEASGKCLTADALVPTNWGLLTVGEIFERCGEKASCASRVSDIAHLGLQVLNEHGAMEPVSGLTHNNRRPVLRVTTSTGKSVRVTANHPMRVLNTRGFVVWRNAADLLVDDVLVGVLGSDADVKDQIDECEALLLGYLVGDGHYNAAYSVMFSQVDEQIRAEFVELMAEFAPDAAPVVYAAKPADVWFRGKAMRDALTERYGLAPTTAPHKHVPGIVRASGPAIHRAFLSALFECDGCVEDDTVTLSTASEQMAREVQSMLAGLGLVSSIHTKRIAAYPDNTYWTVALGNASSVRFVQEVGFRSARRGVQVEAMRAGTRDGARHIPHLSNLLHDLRDSIGGDRAFDRVAGDVFRDFGPGYSDLSVTPERLARIVDWAEARGAGDHPLVQHLRQLAARPATYEKVVAIEPAGDEPTFDLVVPGTHSFVANGLAVHNTTVALHAVANAQRLGGIAAFIDAEHALDPDYAQRLGVDTDALLVSQPDTGEQALEIMDMLIRSGAIDIIVIDSVAALVPRAEIEGEMGDSHVGLQARLMSQALRKITGALNNTNTTAIFINQLREKIGVMFGCLSYDTRITLADGTQEKIGKIVNQKLDVEVLSYDPETDTVVPRRIAQWFDNGIAEEFLQFTVAKSGKNGRAQFAATENHLIRTPGGYREAGELLAGDRVMVAEPKRLSATQWQMVLGGLMGDGALSPNTRGRNGTRFRMGHGVKQVDYLDWKASMFANIEQSRSTNAKGAAFVDLTPLPELAELREAVYLAGQKVLSWDYLKALTPLALAVWYMDDGGFSVRAKGVQERTREGSGRSEICVQAMSRGSRDRLVEHLAGAFDLHPTLSIRGAREQAVLVFSKDETAKLHALVAPYVHPSMDYKLLERFRGQFAVVPEFVATELHPVPARILDIHVKPKTRSMHKFDLEIEGTHNYFVDGVMVHNSPETTTGGRALKFYSSVRLDVRRIETLKDGTDAVGNRTRVKVVKNKCLAAGTRIFDPITGVTHRVEDVVAQRLPIHVMAMDKSGQLAPRPVVDWFDQGEQAVVRVVLRGGSEITVTPDHRLWTERGWVEAGSLQPSDRVARPRRFGQFGESQPYSDEESRMLGYLIGDGYVGGKTPITLICAAAEVQSDAREIAASLGCDAHVQHDHQVQFSHRPGESNALLALTRRAGIHGKLAWEKTLPVEFFDPQLAESSAAHLFVGLLETDGHVSREQTGAIRVGYTTTSHQLAQQVAALLLRFGVTATVRKYDPTTRRPSIIDGREVRGTRDCFDVRVAGAEQVARLADILPVFGPRGRALRDACDAVNGRNRGSQQIYLPESIRAEVLGRLRERGVTAAEVALMLGKPASAGTSGFNQLLGVSRLRRDRLTVVAEELGDEALLGLLGEDVAYAGVRRVEPVGMAQTYDVEVAEFHTLVAEGVVVHNCAPPFKQAEFDILYGQGISREGGLIDMGVEEGFVRKSGAWYTYEGDQLGQGKENARAFLRDNPDLADEIEKKIKEKLGIGPRIDAPADPPTIDLPDSRAAKAAKAANTERPLEPLPAPADF